MFSSHEKSNELSLLMELRLAFGPGTRLWAHRSREDLCYDWLHFKERSTDASFRDFALHLYNREKEQALHSASSHAVRRRVAAILKAYRVGKRRRTAPSLTSPVASSGGSKAPHDHGRQKSLLGELTLAQTLFPDSGTSPLPENEAVR